MLSTFDGSSTAKAWVRKLEAFFLLHPIVEEEAVEISVLHLEGEAYVWWCSHLIHARVKTFAEFTQRLIKTFDGERTKEEKLTPLEELCPNAVTLMEEWPHASTVGAANTLEEGALSDLQEVPKYHQGMKIFPHSLVAANSFDQCGDLLLHDQGSNHIATIDQLGCTTFCSKIGRAHV